MTQRGLPTGPSSAITSHRYFRPLLCFFGVLFLMQALKSQWSSMRNGQAPSRGLGQSQDRERKLVVAHFMLGNTYPFTDGDWETTFDQVEETGLDGLALNLGPEDWQHAQALSAFRVLQSRSSRFTSSNASFPSSGSRKKLELFISMDMNVLPKATAVDGERLRIKISELLQQEGYLRWQGKRVLSTFSGHDASFGGKGWEGWLRDLASDLGEKVFFWPSFFLPPAELLSKSHVDGNFNWNAAWPIHNQPISVDEDQPFLPASKGSTSKISQKAYMASVSPAFFTHYGTTGQWAWNKNWIFPSDRLLYATRWQQLLALPSTARPDVIQVISWNDYGESHAIAPVLGAQPGSEAWTDGMPHEAFRSMTAFFIRQWKAGSLEAGEDNLVRVWMWYRTHPKDLLASSDEVGRPDKADWAEDLINLVIYVPAAAEHAKLTAVIRNGAEHHKSVDAGKTNAFTVPFVPGPVYLDIRLEDEAVLSEQGRRIDSDITRYNFNMWSDTWTVPLR